MQAMLVLGQALELALVLCVRRVLVDEPLELDRAAPTEDIQALWKKFETTILPLPLGALRNLVAHVALEVERPTYTKAASATIGRIGRLKGKNVTPSDVAAIADNNLRHAIEQLLNSPIVDVRNAVMHDLYRPTQTEISTLRKEVGAVIRSTMAAFGVRPAEQGETR